MNNTQDLVAAVERLERQSRRWLPFGVIALVLIVSAAAYSAIALSKAQADLLAVEKQLGGKRAELKNAENQLRVMEQRLKVINAQLTASIQLNADPPDPAQLPPPSNEQERWVYLGTYRPESSQWETRYLEFPENSTPESLTNQELRVRERTGELNVRPGLPNANGILPPPVRVLKPGQSVHIKEVRKWGSSPFWFARVSYAR